MRYYPKISLREMFDSRMHIGHRSWLCDPTMKKYVLIDSDITRRHKIDIIDLVKANFILCKALEFISNVTSRGGTVLFILPQRVEFADEVQKQAKNLAQYSSGRRWIGGTLTNLNAVLSSARKVYKEGKYIEDNADKLPKKEVQRLRKKYNKKVNLFGDIGKLQYRPDLVISFSCKENGVSIAEAKKVGIPVVGVVDTNCNISGVDYPIASNDDSFESFKLILRYITESIIFGTTNFVNRVSSNVGNTNGNNNAKSDSKKKNTKDSQNSGVVTVDIESNDKNIPPTDDKEAKTSIDKKATTEVDGNELDTTLLTADKGKKITDGDGEWDKKNILLTDDKEIKASTGEEDTTGAGEKDTTGAGEEDTIAKIEDNAGGTLLTVDKGTKTDKDKKNTDADIELNAEDTSPVVDRGIKNGRKSKNTA